MTRSSPKPVINGGDTLRVGDHEFIAEIIDSAAAAPPTKPGKKAQRDKPGDRPRVRAGEADWSAELDRLLCTLPPKE